MRLLTHLVVAATLAPWAPVPAGPLDAQAAAQTVVTASPVPGDLQVALILKVLTYDRNFDKRGWTSFHIGIVYAGNDAASSRVGSDIADVFRRLSGKTLKNLPIQFTMVEYTSDSQIEASVRAGRFSVLYIAPGNDRNLGKLLQVCRDAGIITTTGVPEYVERGVAVGIGVRQDRPEIVINLRSSKSAGSEFDVSLLRSARVIK